MLEIGYEVGLEMAGSTVTYQELESWCNMTGVYLSAWEATTLRAMSRSYCDQKVKAVRSDCPPPMYQEKRSKEDMRNEVDQALRAMFTRRAQRNKGLKKGR